MQTRSRQGRGSAKKVKKENRIGRPRQCDGHGAGPPRARARVRVRARA